MAFIYGSSNDVFIAKVKPSKGIEENEMSEAREDLALLEKEYMEFAATDLINCESDDESIYWYFKCWWK